MNIEKPSSFRTGLSARHHPSLLSAAAQAIATGSECIELEALGEEVVIASLVSISDRQLRRTAA
jgi:hypothetical protein